LRSQCEEEHDGDGLHFYCAGPDLGLETSISRIDGLDAAKEGER
jgi:hypothetical protein